MVFLNKLSNRVWLYNELELVKDNHATGMVRIPKDNLVRQWVSQHKKQFQATLKPIGSINDENQLVAVNYGLSDNGYRYPEASKLSPYFRWLDTYKTMWQRIAETSSSTQRNNFIVVRTGKEIPSLSALRVAAKGFGPQQLAFFDDDFKKAMLDIWLWLDPETRGNSVMGSVGVGYVKPQVVDKDSPKPFVDPAVAVKDLPKINLLFQMFDGTSVIVNLGFLNSWLKGQPNQTDQSSTSKKDAKDIQLDFLRFMLALQNYNTQGEKSAREGEEESEADRQSVSGDNEEETITDGEGFVSGSSKAEKPKAGGILDNVPGKLGEKVSQSAQDISEFTASAVDEKEKVAAVPDTSFEEELQVLEEMETRRVTAKGVGLEEAPYDPDDSLPIEDLRLSVLTPPVFGENITKMLDAMVDKGAISAAEYRRAVKSIDNFKNLPDPFTGKGNIIEAASVKPEDLLFDKGRMELRDPTGLAPITAKSTTIEELDRAYIANVYRKEVLACVINITNLGVIVENLEIEERETVEGKVMELVMTVKPLRGKPSTLRHKLPIPDIDGTFKAKGVRYHSRKQINDINFRKIHGDQVGFSSYTSKLFLGRTRAKAHNTTAYISKQLTAAQMGEKEGITRVRPANVYDRNFDCPFRYSTISEHFKGFDVDNTQFGKLFMDFESLTRDKILGPEVRTQVEKDGSVLCGKTEKDLPIFITRDNQFMVRTRNGDEPIGNIYQLLNIDEGKSPVEFAELGILGKTIPVGLILTRQLGFRNLLKLSGVKYRMEEGRSVAIAPNEFKVRFKDRTFVFDKSDRLSALIFGGFGRVEKEIKRFPAVSFDSTEALDVVLESQDMNQMHIREIENLTNGFIDPISLRRLKATGGPQTFVGMLLKGCQDLTTNQAPDTQDTDNQQILGYERFAATIHREVYKAYRSFRNQNSTGRGKINMSHYAVWQQIMEDGTIKTCEDINPIQNLKMHEALTFAGEGGRSRETFNTAARAFHIKAAGRDSEASVDSGDVGYNVFAPWNPTIGDLNGLRLPTDPDKLGFANLLSTSLNLVAGPNHNDMKRNAFTSIQNTHTIACDGYVQPKVQTTLESMVGQRTDSLFCKTAVQDGKVVQLTANGIVVEYKDGTREGIIIGRRYGDAEGTTYPHDIVTDLKLGDKVNKGETIAYNTGWFEPSTLNPKFSVLKFATYATVAFIEAPETHEDSCSIRPQLAKLLQSKTTDPRSYVLRFTQTVHDVLKPGSIVNPDTVLMVIEDEITSGTNIYDAQTTTTLGRLGRNAPRAGRTGVLDRIECLYHGDRVDLSPTLRKLVEASDKFRADQAKAVEKKTISGKASSDWSVEGKPLQLDHMEIVFYITSVEEMGNADKAVFSEQLKTTVGKVEMRRIVTESGREVDAIFAGSSVIKRIVLTVCSNGSTIAIMDATTDRAVKAYFGN